MVIGASSGIGKELAKVLADNGYAVGLAARRLELLHKLQQEIPSQTYVKHIDVTQYPQAILGLRELIAEMGGMDLIIINAGVNIQNPHLDWQSEVSTLSVNVLGFSVMASFAVEDFSVNRFLKLKKKDIETRYRKFRKLTVV